MTALSMTIAYGLVIAWFAILCAVLLLSSIAWLLYEFYGFLSRLWREIREGNL